MAGPDADGLKPIDVAFLGLAHPHPRSYKLLFGYLPAVHVVAAAEADGAILDDFTRPFALRAYSDWRVLLNREAIDLAVIFLPPADCPDAAAACAERGIHVMVETPMAADPAGMRRMIGAAGKAGVALTSPFIWRFHPVGRALKKAAADGELGEVVTAEGRWTGWKAHRWEQAGARWMLRKARSGGGPMQHLGIHWIDFFRWLLDDEVVEVIGRTVRSEGEHDVEDAAAALLTFSRGTVVSLEAGYTLPDSHPGDSEMYMALRGRGGIASWHPSLRERKQRLFICTDSPREGAPGPRTVEHLFPAHPGYAASCGKEFLVDFVGAIREGRAPAVMGRDGLRALQVVEAFYRSAFTGAAVRPADE